MGPSRRPFRRPRHATSVHFVQRCAAVAPLSATRPFAAFSFSGAQFGGSQLGRYAAAANLHSFRNRAEPSAAISAQLHFVQRRHGRFCASEFHGSQLGDALVGPATVEGHAVFAARGLARRTSTALPHRPTVNFAYLFKISGPLRISISHWLPVL